VKGNHYQAPEGKGRATRSRKKKKRSPKKEFQPRPFDSKAGSFWRQGRKKPETVFFRLIEKRRRGRGRGGGSCSETQLRGCVVLGGEEGGVKNVTWRGRCKQSV